VFAIMDNKSFSVNRSRCLISYVNVVVLLIKILNTIRNELSATFVSLGVFVYSTILALNLTLPICQLIWALDAQSIRVEVESLGM
jgi:hypothetical protein